MIEVSNLVGLGGPFQQFYSFPTFDLVKTTRKTFKVLHSIQHSTNV